MELSTLLPRLDMADNGLVDYDTGLPICMAHLVLVCNGSEWLPTRGVVRVRHLYIPYYANLLLAVPTKVFLDTGAQPANTV